MNINNNKSLLQEMQKVNNANKTDTAAKKIDLTKAANGPSFSDYFNKTIERKSEIQFSKHANTRLNSRDINLSTEQMQRIESGISAAGKKGVKDSLVIVDDVALVVNIKNKVVVTAIDKGQDNNVFTNIDGAVIV